MSLVTLHRGQASWILLKVLLVNSKVWKEPSLLGPLGVTKLSGNATCGVVRAVAKSHQGNTVVIEATMSHA